MEPLQSSLKNTFKLKKKQTSCTKHLRTKLGTKYQIYKNIYIQFILTIMIDHNRIIVKFENEVKKDKLYEIQVNMSLFIQNSRILFPYDINNTGLYNIDSVEFKTVPNVDRNDNYCL